MKPIADLPDTVVRTNTLLHITYACFTSNNAVGVHPELLAALSGVNTGNAATKLTR